MSDIKQNSNDHKEEKKGYSLKIPIKLNLPITIMCLRDHLLKKDPELLTLDGFGKIF